MGAKKKDKDRKQDKTHEDRNFKIKQEASAKTPKHDKQAVTSIWNMEKKNIHLATTPKHFTEVCKLLFQSKVKQSSSAEAARKETFNRQRKVTLYLWLEWLEAVCPSGEGLI